MKMKDRMPELKRLAKKLNCYVVDDRAMTMIQVEANDGWSFDNGERSCQWTAYGSQGSYEPEWRQEAIADAIERLRFEPPDNVPFLY